ncbi:MAG: SoxR reducing system RseC family protein [Kosmotoga sp.]|nr:MAG: SoxR reducing system RseC family protein [Kosmotoga sp.]
MRETATVVSVRENIAILTKIRTEACKACPVKETCSSASGSREIKIKARKGEIDLKPGDLVEIEVKNFSATKVAMLLYGIPLAIFIGILIVMYYAGVPDNYSLITSFGGLGITYFLIYRYDKKNREKIMPTVIRKVNYSDVLGNSW